MGTSAAWARLQAALVVVGELKNPSASEPAESTPEQVAALLVDRDGDPVVSEERRAAFAARQQGAAAGTGHPLLGAGDTVRDAYGRSMSGTELAGMRDAKGRPIVIPRA